MVGRSIDQQLKIADIGSGNLAVGILHRSGEHDMDGVHRGPTFAADSRNGTVRDVRAGDVVIIAAGTLSIPDHLTYLGRIPLACCRRVT